MVDGVYAIVTEGGSESTGFRVMGMSVQCWTWRFDILLILIPVNASSSVINLWGVVHVIQLSFFWFDSYEWCALSSQL